MALTNLHKTEWMEDAECKGADINIFFQEQGHSNYNQGKLICARCRVQRDCLDFAMSNGGTHDDEFGLWGGKTPKERRKMKKIIRVNRRAI